MANEIRIQAYIQINNGAQQYVSQPSAFTADMEGQAGPTPGSILVSKYGTDVSLAQLVLLGGWIRMINMDDDDTGANYVEWGVYDLDSPTGQFTPVGEMWPGEPAVFRLSRMIGKQLGTGSGTAQIDSGLTLRLKAVGAAVQVKVEAFDR